jgi:hypothetical protein
MLAVPGTVLGRRPRGDKDIHEDKGLGANDGRQQPQCKRGKGEMAVDGVLEWAVTSNDRHKPATRALARIDSMSKSVGRGAERLAATKVQGVCHQSLLGPSVQQGSMEATAPGQPTWTEGSVEGVKPRHISSVVQQRASTEDDKHEEQVESELFRIPRRLEMRHQALLATTQADRKREAVDVLKCRICPGADFSNWEDFKRHCDAAEAHPVKITYCDHCGDFFARGDALKRHRNNPPRECISVAADIANSKRKETDRVHKEFEAELERCLRSGEGEEIGIPFAWRIKEMFPDSSKKGSREQSRLPVFCKAKFLAGR